MLTPTIIFGASLLGILGHWLTRWEQGRTSSTFGKYLSTFKAHTLASVFANLTSAGIVYASLPEDIPIKTLLLVAGGVYMTGYAWDSKLNKDAQPKPRTYKETPGVKKSIADILDDDRRL